MKYDEIIFCVGYGINNAYMQYRLNGELAEEKYLLSDYKLMRSMRDSQFKVTWHEYKYKV